jgi:hypothetical protein
VRDDDLPLLALPAVLRDDLPVGVLHVQAVDHHDRAHVEVQPAAAEPQHLGQVRLGEDQPRVNLVVFLVERAAGDEDADGHGASVQAFVQLVIR